MTGLMPRSVPLVEANTEALRFCTATAERLAVALNRASPAGLAGPGASDPAPAGLL